MRRQARKILEVQYSSKGIVESIMNYYSASSVALSCHIVQRCSQLTPIRTLLIHIALECVSIKTTDAYSGCHVVKGGLVSLAICVLLQRRNHVIDFSKCDRLFGCFAKFRDGHVLRIIICIDKLIIN